MSEVIWPYVGTAEAEFGDVIDVHRDPATGDVRIALREHAKAEGGEGPFAWLAPPQLAGLRELLDRAAMPGQVSG